MATVRADGHEVSLLLRIGKNSLANLSSDLLHVRYGFLESTIYVEEEILSEIGKLVQSILIDRTNNHYGFIWNLPAGCYRAFGLPATVVDTSTEILTLISNASTAQFPVLKIVKREPNCSYVADVLRNPVNVNRIERQFLSPVVELSSDSEEAPDNVCRPSFESKIRESSLHRGTSESVGRHDGSAGSLLFSRPPLYPQDQGTSSVVECLRKIGSIRGCRNKLAHIDFDLIDFKGVSFLPTVFDDDIIFELPPCRSVASSSSSKSMTGMDKRYDGHTWCCTMTSNIHNDFRLKFKKSSCAGHLACINFACDYIVRTSKRNETEWSSNTNSPFLVGSIAPRDSILLCKVYKTPPTCVNFCDARIYYVVGPPQMTRACVHLGSHRPPVADGLCRDSIDTISRLLAKEVARTPVATTSAIALAASKEFLDTFLVHLGDEPKEMLKGPTLEAVMDKFQVLSSPNVRNIVASFRSNGCGGGEIDRLLAMKKQAKIEFIHDSVFLGQGQNKVYLFKMVVDGLGSGVDLVKRMQPGGDLENCWLMFDHVKRIRGWTTIACHVYDSSYCKVMTIAVCDMQSEDTEG